MREELGIQPAQSLSSLLMRFCFSSTFLFGALIGGGAFLLHQEKAGWIGLVIAVMSVLVLSRKKLFDISIVS